MIEMPGVMARAVWTPQPVGGGTRSSWLVSVTLVRRRPGERLVEQGDQIHGGKQHDPKDEQLRAPVVRPSSTAANLHQRRKLNK